MCVRDDWGLSEDRLRRLSVLANEALALQHKSGPETQPIHTSLDGSQKMWMRPENHPDLKAWLASPRLKAAVDAYLPNAYKQAKVVALRIGNDVKTLPEVRTPSTPAPDYWSGYWHHDRCKWLCGNLIYGAFAPARWRGDVGSSPLNGASAATPSPRNDLVKSCRVHPSHWLISTQAPAPWWWRRRGTAAWAGRTCRKGSS